MGIAEIVCILDASRHYVDRFSRQDVTFAEPEECGHRVGESGSAPTSLLGPKRTVARLSTSWFVQPAHRRD